MLIEYNFCFKKAMEKFMQFSAQNLGPNLLYKGGKGEEKRGQNENEKVAWACRNTRIWSHLFARATSLKISGTFPTVYCLTH